MTPAMDSDTRLALGSVLFAILAAYQIYSGLSAPMAFPTEQGEVANLQMIHLRSMNLDIGIAAAIISAILAVGSAIAGAITKASEQPS